MNGDSNDSNTREDLTLQTHNGKIHSNEVASVALLVNYFGRKGKTISVIRSRNINISNILVDIGDIYDHNSLKYDHHGPDFSEHWENSEVPLSSTGLIWRHYGREIIEMYLTENNEEYDYSENYTDDIIEELKDIIYFNLFLEIDAYDNGFNLPFNPNTLNIPNIVSAGNYTVTSNDDIQNEKFFELVNLIGNIFDIKFKEIINSYFNFSKDLERVRELDLRGDYLIINEKIPTIFKCLENIDNNINFLIFCNKDDYSIKARNIEKFTPVIPIADEKYLLNKLTNPEDIIFVHKKAFLAKSRTLETAKEIIQLSIEIYKSNEEMKKENIENIENKKDKDMNIQDILNHVDIIDITDTIESKKIKQEEEHFSNSTILTIGFFIAIGITGLSLYLLKPNE